MTGPTACNICGGAEFVAGFKGRLTFGKPPQCAKCASAERHRVVREVYLPLRPLLSSMKALQFSSDSSVDPAWFAGFTRSVYGSSNSMDMSDTKLPAGAFDIVISNHVLEHVADDDAAIRDLVRVVGENGLVHFTVPSPAFRFQTKDWGFADPARNEHYRDYGADFAMRMAGRAPGIKAMGVVATDPVTGIADIVYFFASSEPPLARFARAWRGSHIAVVRVA